MFPSFAIAGALVIVVLALSLLKRFADDRIQRLMDGRRPTSRVVSRGEFMEGSRRLKVAMALSDRALHYENSEMQASLDLEWIREVSYENELVTGQHVGSGKVMRLRCFNQLFEFILPAAVVTQWQVVLSPRTSAAATVAVTATELSRADDDGWGAAAAAVIPKPA